MDHYRALVGADNSDLMKVAGTIGSDEHGHSLIEVFNENRAIEGVEDRLIADTMLSRTVDDSWSCHKLPCLVDDCKITCEVVLIREPQCWGWRFNGLEDDVAPLPGLSCGRVEEIILNPCLHRVRSRHSDRHTDSAGSIQPGRGHA